MNALDSELCGVEGFSEIGNLYLSNVNGDKSGSIDAQPAVPALGTEEFRKLSRSLDNRPLLYRFIKRFFDVAISVSVIALLIILWPLTLILLVVIAVQTKGFPIYVQERIGQYGKTIRVPKFRSMVVDSENVEKYLNQEQLEEWRKERKVTDDPRIVPIGTFMRRTSLDELCNFVLAFTGDMSVIGPRPIVKEETKWYGDRLPEVLSVPQGITGWWQCTSRNDANFESGERQKLELSYVERCSLNLDVEIMIRTVKIMFGKEKTGR